MGGSQGGELAQELAETQAAMSDAERAEADEWVRAMELAMASSEGVGIMGLKTKVGGGYPCHSKGHAVHTGHPLLVWESKHQDQAQEAR
jgi:hypothetical protein